MAEKRWYFEYTTYLRLTIDCISIYYNMTLGYKVKIYRPMYQNGTSIIYIDSGEWIIKQNRDDLITIGRECGFHVNKEEFIKEVIEPYFNSCDKLIDKDIIFDKYILNEREYLTRR